MGKSARMKKLRRQARELGLEPAKWAFASNFLQQRPDDIILDSPAAEKMSEVLQEFAEPLLEIADSPDEMEHALLIAMTAWNYSLVNSGEKPPGAADPILADPVTRDVFEFLLARKQELYPDNHRAILDYQLIPRGNELQFNVISTPAT